MRKSPTEKSQRLPSRKLLQNRTKGKFNDEKLTKRTTTLFKTLAAASVHEAILTKENEDEQIEKDTELSDDKLSFGTQQLLVNTTKVLFFVVKLKFKNLFPTKLNLVGKNVMFQKFFGTISFILRFFIKTLSESCSRFETSQTADLARPALSEGLGPWIH